MNPLTNVRNQNKINQRELDLGYTGTKNSWHNKYKDSAWIFIGGLPYDLTEGDILCIFSQYGEVVNINLVRDKGTGKSKGFCFICYEDQRSTILSVDNFNGAKVLGRILRVDHVESYRKPKEDGEEDEITRLLRQHGCAPQAPPVPIQAVQKEEPEIKTSKKKKVKKEKKKKKKRQSSSSESEDDVPQKGNPSVEPRHRSIKQERESMPRQRSIKQERESMSSSPPQDRSSGKYQEKSSSGVRQDVNERIHHSDFSRDTQRREGTRRDRERSRSPVQSHRRERDYSRTQLHEHSHRNGRARSRSQSHDRSRRNGRERSRSHSIEKSRSRQSGNSRRRERSRSRERYSRERRK